MINALSYALNPYRTIERNRGSCFTVKGFDGRPTVVFSDPDAIRDIFAADGDALRSGEANLPLLGPILGRRSVLLLDGDRHLRERRLMLPPFHGERMQAYGLAMRAITDRAIDAWPVGRPFPVHPSTQAITFDVILRTVFGLTDPAELERVAAPLRRVLGLANSRVSSFIGIPALRFDLGRFSPWGRFVRDRDAFRSQLAAEIARRRAEGTAGRDDILTMLLEARDERGEPMDDEQLLDEMFTLLMAGHETTATAIAWVLWHVLPRRDVVERLRAELRAVAGDGSVAPEQVAKLEYLDAVVKESARLTPVATNVNRVTTQPVTIGGWRLPAGIVVSAAIYLTHHRADLWPDPERFHPDRFIGLRPSPHTFFPFGGGTRRCLGAAFATYETKVVLAEIIARTDLRIAPGYRMRPVLRAVTVAPSKGLPVVLERRLGS